MSLGLRVGTCEFRNIVDDPVLPDACGLEVTYDEIVAIYPADREPLYRDEPDGSETTEILPLGATATKRFVDYYQHFNMKENIGHNDCFSLVAHISSGQALETLQGQQLSYRSRGAVMLASPFAMQPGGFYLTGKVDGAKVTGINHWMVGLGHDRALARWGHRSDSHIGIGTASMALSIYGGQLLRLSGELYRSNE